jgi:hypothetical protein
MAFQLPEGGIGAAMEHRWGSRIAVDIAVRISARPSTIGVGRILDLSMSGAWIRARLTLPVLSRVIVIVHSSQARKHEAASLGAYVTRTTREGFGVEWCELDPPSFGHLLHPHAFAGNARGAVPDYTGCAPEGIELLTDISSMTELLELPPS